MRQPKIFIRLPSNGEYWPPGSLTISETGDYPVYSSVKGTSIRPKRSKAS
jgi:hypothetical protein